LEETRDRCVAFMHALAERQARLRVPFEWGTALFNHDLPLVWDLNYLSVVDAAAVSASQLSAAA
jgi:hypothetical protein